MSKKNTNTARLSTDEIKNLEKAKSSLITRLARMTLFVNNQKDVDQDEIILTDEKHLNLIFTIFKKKEGRSITENQLLLNYLNTMKGLVEMIRTAFTNNNDVVSQILSTMSLFLKYEKYEKNNLIFKLGDKGDKFYIILKGSVDILIAKEKKVSITKTDYLKYLATLKKYDEKELLSKCLQINLNNYGIEIVDNLGKAEFSQMKNDKRSSIKSNINSKRPSYVRQVSVTSIEENNFDKKISFNLNNEMFLPNLEPNTPNKSKTQRISNASNTNVITSDEYINRLKVYREYENNINFISKTGSSAVTKESLIQVVIFEYHCITTLSTGQNFGDVALENSNQKRIATVITKEETHFGILNKESYGKCIKEVNDKSKRNNLNFILTSNIFSGVNKNTLEKRYFKYFVNLTVNRGEKLVKENEQFPALFLIKNGQYDLTIYKSYYEITEILKLFDQKFSRDSLFGKTEIRRSISDSEFKKFYYQKRNIRVSIIKDIDIIGLEDYFVQGKNAISVECTSIKGEVLKLDYNFFQEICSNVETVKEEYENFKSIKKNILLQKILKIREIGLLSFNNMNDRGKNNQGTTKGQIENVIIDSTNRFGKLNTKMIFSYSKSTEKNRINSDENLINEIHENQPNKEDNNSNKFNQKEVVSLNFLNFTESSKINIDNIRSMSAEFLNENFMDDPTPQKNDLNFRSNNSSEKEDTAMIPDLKSNQLSKKNKFKNIKISPLTQLSSNDFNTNITSTNKKSKNQADMKIKVESLDKDMRSGIKHKTFSTEISPGSKPNKLLTKLGKELETSLAFFNLKKSFYASSPKNIEPISINTSPDNKKNSDLRNRILNLGNGQVMSNRIIKNITRGENSIENDNINLNNNLYIATKTNSYSFINPPSINRFQNGKIRKSSNSEFALKEYYLQPSIENPVYFKTTVNNSKYLNTSPNSIINTTNLQLKETNNQFDLKNISQVSKLVNNKANILFGNKNGKLARYNEDVDYFIIDNSQLEKKKKEFYIQKKSGLKLTKTHHNMFRFSKNLISKKMFNKNT